MNEMRRLLALFVIVGLLGGIFLAYTLLTPFGPSRQVFVDIPSGTSTRRIAQMLTDAGVIRSEWAFLAARAISPTASLQAGEYGFDRPATVWDVFRKIARGEVFYHEVVVPEGSNMFDIGAALAALGIMDADAFVKIARSPALIRDLAPESPSLEGYLFPATYRVTRRSTPKQVAQEMTNRFRRAWRELNAPAGTDIHRMVTLASLVEKESAVAGERPDIAAVYANRLRIGMKLDCDPTVIYAALLDGRYRGTIYRSDLDNPHPYNTYRNVGLPPGPIANPGMGALKAALNPADNGYLFFVAKPGGSGAHQFSATLAEHNNAVQAYRSAAAR